MPLFDDLLPAQTDSPEATMALGARLAGRLEAGDVLALYGDLGAGKTHLIKGICEALGVDPGGVSSPTFALVNEYAGRDLAIAHVDAYRIERPEELVEIGVEEYLEGEALALVEWPERAEDFLPSHTLRLRLTHQGESARRIEVL
jgi:tRNA threonylcarbamoyladenosine biosynthesis protein TsaE